MNCPKCGSPNPDGQKFCGSCGAELPTESAQVSKPETSTFSYTDNKQAQAPKKKKHGCLVSIIVVVVLIVVFFIWLGSGDSSDNSSSSDNKKTEQSSKKAKEYVDNITAVATKPDDYKGKYIKFSGYVSSVDETDDMYGLQIYVDPDHNNSVLLEVSKDLMNNDKISEDSYIIADAKIDGSYDGETILGVSSTWAYLEAESIEKSTFQDTFGKAHTTWEFSDKSVTQNGVTVSVTKVEFSDMETRVYLSVANNSSSNFTLQDYSAKIVQGSNQYETTTNYDADYKEIPSEMLPGVTAEGIMCFDKMDPAQFQLHLEGYSDDWDADFQPFTYDLSN